MMSRFCLFWSFFVTHFHVKIRNNFRAHFSKRIYHGTSLLARRSIPRGVSPCCHAKIRERRISLSFESREKEENARSQRRQRRLLGPRSLFFSLGNAALFTRTRGKRRAKMMTFRSAPVSRREGGTRTERADLDETRNVFARERRSFAGGGVVWVVVDSAR
jgi:hypothetical protein